MKNVNVADITKIQKTSLKTEPLTTAQWIGAALPGVQIIILILLLLKKADEFVAKSKEYQATLLLCQLFYFFEKLTKISDPDSRQIATEAAKSNAPPTAPPDTTASSPAPFRNIDIQKILDKKQRQFYFRQLYNIFDIIYVPNYNNSDPDDKINNDILVGDIRRKIVADIVQHAANYPQFYPAIFSEWTEKTEKKTQNFINFKIRQFWRDITTRETSDASRTATAMLRARQAYFAIHGGIASLDAVIPTADGDNATLYDYISDQTSTGISPEADLLLTEYIQEHIGDVDIDDEPAQALFTLEDEDEPDENVIMVNIKQPRPRTGRAKRLASQQAFDFGGGDDNE